MAQGGTSSSSLIGVGAWKTEKLQSRPGLEIRGKLGWVGNNWRREELILTQMIYLFYVAKYFGFCRNLPLNIPLPIAQAIPACTVRSYYLSSETCPLLTFAEPNHSVIAAFVEYLCFPESVLSLALSSNVFTLCCLVPSLFHCT